MLQVVDVFGNYDTYRCLGYCPSNQNRSNSINNRRFVSNMEVSLNLWHMYMLSCASGAGSAVNSQMLGYDIAHKKLAYSQWSLQPSGLTKTLGFEFVNSQRPLIVPATWLEAQVSVGKDKQNDLWVKVVARVRVDWNNTILVWHCPHWPINSTVRI